MWWFGKKRRKGPCALVLIEKDDLWQDRWHIRGWLHAMKNFHCLASVLASKVLGSFWVSLMLSKQMGRSVGRQENICLSRVGLLRKRFPTGARKTASSPILLQLRRWLRSCIIANSARLILKNKNISRLTQGRHFVPNIITWKVALELWELMSFDLLIPSFSLWAWVKTGVQSQSKSL